MARRQWGGQIYGAVARVPRFAASSPLDWVPSPMPKRRSRSLSINESRRDGLGTQSRTIARPTRIAGNAFANRLSTRRRDCAEATGRVPAPRCRHMPRGRAYGMRYKLAAGLRSPTPKITYGSPSGPCISQARTEAVTVAGAQARQGFPSAGDAIPRSRTHRKPSSLEKKLREATRCSTGRP